MRLNADQVRLRNPNRLETYGFFALISDIAGVLRGAPKRTVTEPAVAGRAGNRHSHSAKREAVTQGRVESMA